MATLLADRVLETSTSTGTGSFLLAGASAGYQSFATAFPGVTSAPVIYCITDGTNWETGVGAYTASTTTLVRSQVTSSSNGGAPVSFPAGTKQVFNSQVAQNFIWPDYSGQNAFTVHGDSLSLGNGSVTPATDGFVPLLATSSGWIVSNLGRSGDQIADQIVLANATTITNGQVTVVEMGTNDPRQYGADPNKLSVFKKGHLALLAFLAIPDSKKIKARAAAVTGTWINDTANGNIGISSNTIGSTLTASVFGTVVYIGTIVINSGTAMFTVTIDGVSQGTFTSSPGATITTYNALTYSGQLLRFPNLAEGKHTVVITTTNGGTSNDTYVDWIAGNGGVVTKDGPTVIATNGHQLTSTGYNVAPTNSSDATQAVIAGIIRDNVRLLASDGLLVGLADTHSRIDKTANLNADGVHPNNSGYSVYRDAILEGLKHVGRYTSVNLNGALSSTVTASQPGAFNVTLSVDQSIPSATFTKILFDTKEFDTDNAFNLGKFQPSTPGYYQIDCSLYFSTAGNASRASLYKNGVEYKSGSYTAATGSCISVASFVVYLNGTDYIEAYCYSSGVNNVQHTSAYTWFGGYRVGNSTSVAVAQQVVSIPVAAGDEITALTTGTKVTFVNPYSTPLTLTNVLASLTTAQATGALLTVDVKLAGTSVFSILPTFNNAATNTSAATTPAVLSTTTIPAYGSLTISVTQIGDGTAAGLKVYLNGTVGTPVAATVSDIFSPLSATALSLNGASVLTVGRQHICSDSGTPANYAITLPTAVGNVGAHIGVRIKSSTTALITLTGNGTETIDGQTTRILWARESCILESDGVEWVKIGGRAVPVQVVMRRQAAQAISATTWTFINMDTVVSDNTAGLLSANRTANTTTGRFVAFRGGRYASQGFVSLQGLTSGNECYGGVVKNVATPGDNPNAFILVAVSATNTSHLNGSGNFTLVAGDFMGATTYAGSACSTRALATVYPTLSVTEIPDW